MVYINQLTALFLVQRFCDIAQRGRIWEGLVLYQSFPVRPAVIQLALNTMGKEKNICYM